MKILVTGAAGFIGFHLIENLLKNSNIEIIGIDNINNYYDVNLKYKRLNTSGIEQDKIVQSNESPISIQSTKYSNYQFFKIDITNSSLLSKLFEKECFTHVINLAAQAGVRYSIENPHAYIQSNIVGFLNILECCRSNNIKHLVYASSSSVYGANTKTPFCEKDTVDSPVSLYAATKKSNELMAYTYSHLYSLPTTGLRFFTVYGPFGRPDMAPMLFANAINSNKPINVFNNGDMERDFTYIDDIVEGVSRCITVLPKNKSLAEVYNIGNSKPIKLMEFISIMEDNLGKKAIKNFMPMQDGDVRKTWASVDKLRKNIQYQPSTKLNEGVERFINWYMDNCEND